MVTKFWVGAILIVEAQDVKVEKIWFLLAITWLSMQWASTSLLSCSDGKNLRFILAAHVFDLAKDQKILALQQRWFFTVVPDPLPNIRREIVGRNDRIYSYQIFSRLVLPQKD